MADMYDTNTCSSPLTTRPVLESDEFSLFLQNLLHSSSSSDVSQKNKLLQIPFQEDQQQQRISYLSTTRVPDSEFRFSISDRNDPSTAAIDSSSNLILSSSTSRGISFPSSEMKDFSDNRAAGDTDAVAVSVKRRNFLADNDLDDYDCESDEGIEASEGPSKSVPSRGSSKRSRAAEVHNLSEKRRRSRINEKMKALQNLIPNSNKTDKASMLDEAIEYLKQLQLQVQMLSMRNGLSLHPLYLPGMLQPLQLPQMRMDLGEGNAVPQHMNIGTETLAVNQESTTRNSFGLSSQSNTFHKPMVIPNMINLTHPETSYGLDSSIQLHEGPFQLSTASEEIYRDEVPAQRLHISHPPRNASDSISFDVRSSIIENTRSLESCVLRGSISQPMLPKDTNNNQ